MRVTCALLVLALCAASAVAQSEVKCGGTDRCTSTGASCVKWKSLLPLVIQSTCTSGNYNTTVLVCLDGISQSMQLGQILIANSSDSGTGSPLNGQACSIQVQADVGSNGTLTNIDVPMPFSYADATIPTNFWYTTNVVLSIAMDNGQIVLGGNGTGSGWLSSCAENKCLFDSTASCTSPTASTTSVCATYIANATSPMYVTFFVVFTGTDSKGNPLTSSTSNPMTFKQYSGFNAGADLFNKIFANVQNAWSTVSSKISHVVPSKK